MKGRWSVVALVGAALLVGTAFGPAVVDAATAGLVRVEGAGSTHVAKVDTAGRLSVTDGTAHTRAGQLQVATAAPGHAVTKLLHLTCNAGGAYKVPSGHALVITGVTFFLFPAGAATDDEQVLEIGPAATPCKKIIAAAASPGVERTVPQTFDPGIAVPAGGAVGGELDHDNAGSAELYGYLVPAADVPAGAMSGRSHGLRTVRH